MMIRLYDADTMEPVGEPCDIHDCFDASDDAQAEECLAAMALIEQGVDVLIGGGAAPLFLLVKADR